MEEPEFGPPRGLALAGPGRAGTRVRLCSRRKQIKQPGLFFSNFYFYFFLGGVTHWGVWEDWEVRVIRGREVKFPESIKTSFEKEKKKRNYAKTFTEAGRGTGLRKPCGGTPNLSSGDEGTGRNYK